MKTKRIIYVFKIKHSQGDIYEVYVKRSVNGFESKKILIHTVYPGC